MGAGRDESAASYRSPRPFPTAGLAAFPPLAAAAPHGLGDLAAATMEPGFLTAECAPLAMHRLPVLTLAALALALLAAVPARANDRGAAAAEAVAGSVPATGGSERRHPHRPRHRGGSSRRPRATAPRCVARPGAGPPAPRSTGGSYRVSLSHGKLDMGMGFDAPVGAATRTTRHLDPAGPIPATLPSLSVGLRRDTGGAAPSSLIERARAEGTTPSSTQRVGLEWKPAQSSLFVRGGVRLTGDDRITMRVKGGRVGVYMKSTF